MGEMESGVTGCYFCLAVIMYRTFTPRRPEAKQATAGVFSVVSYVFALLPSESCLSVCQLSWI